MLERRYKIGEQFSSELPYYAENLFIDLAKDDVACSIFTDRKLLSIFGQYYQCQPFMRLTPNMVPTKPTYNARVELDTESEEDVNAIGQHPATKWHWDTPNQLILMVALIDLPPDGTTTLYAKKSHKSWHRSLLPDKDRTYSEAFIKHNWEVVPFSGKKGTAIIFDSNGLHRYFPVCDKYRNIMNIMVTPGNHILDKADFLPGDMPLRESGETPVIPNMALLDPGQKKFLQYFYDL